MTVAKKKSTGIINDTETLKYKNSSLPANKVDLKSKESHDDAFAFILRKYNKI